MDELTYEVADRVATITLNRPEKLNPFTGPMLDAWTDALVEAQRDDGVHVVVVTGAGRAFCAGGDVGRMGEAKGTALELKNELWERVHRIPKTLEAMDKPVIAMVNGLAVGAGMGMTLMCDLRIASEEARFSTGYVNVGLVPGDGDAFFLPRLVGIAKALELLWTIDFVDAREAERLGIVNKVVPAGDLKQYTWELARKIADGPQIAIRLTKRLAYQSLRLDLRTHLDLASSHMAVVRDTEDHREGVRAFKEKRPAKFTGR
jgi:2-(1,2-epoxy-1,2-dihydrophenyl)acetyl-CoA isomerase